MPTSSRQGKTRQGKGFSSCRQFCRQSPVGAYQPTDKGYDDSDSRQNKKMSAPTKMPTNSRQEKTALGKGFGVF